MNRIFIAILINFIAVGGVAAQQQDSVIVMFGDSITVGFNSTRPIRNGNGSTTLSGPRQYLSDALNNPDQPRPSTVVNWGEGGTNTERGLQRISSTLASTRSVYPDDRCFVLLMYGTNDFGFGLGTSTTLFNTRQMIRQIRARGCVPIVGNLTPRSDRDLAPLSRAVGSVAAAENAVVVDHFATFTVRPLVYFLELERSVRTGELLRLHPNEAGYRLIARNWFDRALSRLIVPIELQPVLVPIYQLLLDD